MSGLTPDCTAPLSAIVQIERRLFTLVVVICCVTPLVRAYIFAWTSKFFSGPWSSHSLGGAFCCAACAQARGDSLRGADFVRDHADLDGSGSSDSSAIDACGANQCLAAFQQCTWYQPECSCYNTLLNCIALDNCPYFVLDKYIERCQAAWCGMCDPWATPSPTPSSSPNSGNCDISTCKVQYETCLTQQSLCPCLGFFDECLQYENCPETLVEEHVVMCEDVSGCAG